MRWIWLISLFSLACTKSHSWKDDFAGDWYSDTGNGKFHEVWKSHEKGLVGYGMEIDQKGDTLFKEKLELMEKGETLVYVAYPGGERRVEFTGKKENQDRYIFNNPDNDFPSQIEYRFTENEVAVTLKGRLGEDEANETFIMKKNHD